ncbi:uncharacterized protein LOC130417589 isoform X3 [Triplophysa dalaica]|uniref:uncharacterized protein LOC130417589 isoform X3 n=1 Tax=Triplophysa dalaica TaxID=1582913 RepID=UPI0024DF636C|nr:uncharacterized protein LOC130417589 isoform X3 [Triplophysa dalaica]
MEGTEAGKGFAKRRQSCKLSAGPVRSDELAVMLKHQRGAVRAVMDMSLFVLLLLSESTGYISIQLWKNWTDAQSYCRQYHTDLATVSSNEDTNLLNAVVGCGPWVWIGLFFDFWQWSDQWSLFFRNWAAGFTSQTSVLGNCVTMSTISGKWIQIPCTEQHPFICYGDLKKQIIRLNLSHDGKYNLNDPSKQTAILNKITEKLKNAGLDSHCTLSWRKDEGGEVFHPESKHTLKSNIRCDSN